MKFTKTCWLAVAIGQLLAWQEVPAAGTGGKHPGIQRVRVSRSQQADHRETRDDYRTGYIAGLHDGKHGATQIRLSRRDTQAAQHYALRERAERDARAERIYRNSQLSAPIIIDAKACKRIGAHGESIYENCQLAATCNTRTDVATCQSAE